MDNNISTDRLKRELEDFMPIDYKEKTFNKLNFKVKQYLSFERKRVIAELTCVNSFVDDARDIGRFDWGLKEAMFSIHVIREYTNLDITDDPFEMYDMFKSTGLLDYIMQSIPEKELAILKDMTNERIKEEFRLQELTTSIGYGLEGTLTAINEKMTQGIETISNFDVGQLKTLLNFVDVGDSKNTAKKLKNKD